MHSRLEDSLHKSIAEGYKGEEASQPRHMDVHSVAQHGQRLNVFNLFVHIRTAVNYIQPGWLTYSVIDLGLLQQLCKISKEVRRPIMLWINIYYINIFINTKYGYNYNKLPD